MWWRNDHWSAYMLSHEKVSKRPSLNSLNTLLKRCVTLESWLKDCKSQKASQKYTLQNHEFSRIPPYNEICVNFDQIILLIWNWECFRHAWYFTHHSLSYTVQSNLLQYLLYFSLFLHVYVHCAVHFFQRHKLNVVVEIILSSVIQTRIALKKWVSKHAIRFRTSHSKIVAMSFFLGCTSCKKTETRVNFGGCNSAWNHHKLYVPYIFWKPRPCFFTWCYPIYVIHMKKNRLMVAFDSNKGPNLKVVKWCWKRWNGPILMHIYDKQCVFMQTNQWKGSNIQIQCFYNGTSGAPC